jgi:hypothetical protein
MISFHVTSRSTVRSSGTLDSTITRAGRSRWISRSRSIACSVSRSRTCSRIAWQRGLGVDGDLDAAPAAVAHPVGAKLGRPGAAQRQRLLLVAEQRAGQRLDGAGRGLLAAGDDDGVEVLEAVDAAQGAEVDDRHAGDRAEPLLGGLVGHQQHAPAGRGLDLGEVADVAEPVGGAGLLGLVRAVEAEQAVARAGGVDDLDHLGVAARGDGLDRERVALAQRIDTLLAELAPLVEQWSGLGLQLYGASVIVYEL